MINNESHYVSRNNWLRAVVLGANDGILSTTSIVIGITAANPSRQGIVLAALASVVAGACSMAAGEYVSVSQQADVEKSDLKREMEELKTMPDAERLELANIYVNRGLDKQLALEVAGKLMEHNALEAHARDELGINDLTKANALQASLASAASFILGGLLPFLVSLFAPVSQMIFFQYGFAIFFLGLSGSIAAKMGGANVLTSVFRICLWGTIAMCITALVGYLFGVNAA